MSKAKLITKYQSEQITGINSVASLESSKLELQLDSDWDSQYLGILTSNSNSLEFLHSIKNVRNNHADTIM